eukprot:TRINITY_DN63973_c0_g1_i1.p1 TRINITY_DN63973_c0_g1~~TRINITY_DN63973_c0_g1_i1.p1  ORF type:complete len:484 (+),score=103.63 TRINITY_DN63973_c0_g1_i1:23-1453(+)
MAPTTPNGKENAKSSSGARKCPERGVGLTPRVFDALVKNSDSWMEALPTTYVKSINQHVSGNFMAQQWCPVVVEEPVGIRKVLYVDTLDVREFRLEVRQELSDVQDKRGRVLRRIKHIREQLPKAHPRLAVERLEREIKDAEVRAKEPLIKPLPEGVNQLTVWLEASPRMVLLESVCKSLEAELPAAMEAAGASKLSIIAVGLQHFGDRGRKGKADPEQRQELQDLELLDALSAEGRQAISDWLQRLSELAQASAAAVPRSQSRSRRGDDRSRGNCIRLADALKRGTMADALAGGGGTGLLIACSPPSDLEACESQMARSEMVLQIAGVLGASSEDPELPFENLAIASARGSRLNLWFGQDYWVSFAEARRRQLEHMRMHNPQLIHDEEGSSVPESVKATGEVVSGEMLEMRLLERVLRECYVDEQRCQEELTCLNRVLEKTLVDPDSVKEAMKPIPEDALVKPVSETVAAAQIAL